MHPEQMLERAPHSPMAGTGWLHGWRLTFGGEDIGWEGALATIVEDPLSKVFVVLYDMTKEDEKTPRPLGRLRAGHPQEDPMSGGPHVVGHHHRSGAGVAVRHRCVGGRHTVGALPRRDGRRRRNRRRPSGIRARPAHPPGAQHRPRHFVTRLPPRVTVFVRDTPQIVGNLRSLTPRERSEADDRSGRRIPTPDI